MQTAMDRLSGFVSRRRLLVLGFWVVVLVVSLPFAARQTDHLTAGGFGVPGSGSLAVQQAIKEFPGVQSESLVLVFDNPGRNAAQVRAAIDDAARRVKGVPNISVPPQALAAARSGAGRPIVLLPLGVRGGADVAADAATTLRDKLGLKPESSMQKTLESLGLRDKPETRQVPLHLIGEQALWAAMQDVSKQDLEKAESAGFPIVFIVLLAVFGSLAAALLPLALGIAAVIITGAVIFFLSQSIEMSIFVTNIASMLGIGVAVDYSLFVLARYREEIAGGASTDEARGTAMRTSGLAVAISGVTVMISLAGLFLIDSTMMHSMAVGAIVVVAIAILAAVTLLPALIALLGMRVYRRGRIIGWFMTRLGGLRRGRPRPAGAPTFWQRWTETLMRRPVLFASVATATMLLIAVPALSLRWGTAALAQLPANNDTRIGFERASEALGPGALGPIQVVADFGGRPVDQGAVAAFVKGARTTDGVARVDPPVTSRDGHSALVVVTPDAAPETDAAIAVVERLRAPDGPASSLRAATVSVGGAAAGNKDFSDLVSGSLWKILVFVLLFSYLVLLVLLRSVLLPLKAVLMNVLSVAAAYGVLVMVFQYGWFDGVIGFDHLGYVNAPTPPLLLAIVFGLSMDYEVFLLSRIRERHNATHDNRTAVAEGLAASAKTISSAALIMVAVFSIFALTGLPQVKEIGVGLSVAILLDATLVRLVLVPATMELMGDWNWWVPSWLDRILPELDIEGGGEPAPEVVPAPVAK